MKTKRTVSVFGVKLLPSAGFILAGLLFFTPAAPAAPRPSWVGLIPEVAWPLYHESFDELLEIYPYGTTNAQITVGNFTFDESWTGYALQRSGASVTPFYVPAVDSGYTNIICNKGMIRCWFEPTMWSSVTQTNGTGPGAVAVLFELDAVGNNESANVWSLQVNADGTMLSLIAHSDDSPALLVQTNISWQAGQSHLIALDYLTNGIDLYIDGELAAQGASVPTVPPQLAALFVGSTLAGTSVAGGNFDELCCFAATGSRFYHPPTAVDMAFYWNMYSAQAALGPVSAEEIEARAERIATMRAQREEMLSELFLDDIGTEMMAMRGTYGAVSDCPTNVPIYMTNIWAGFETNGTMTVTFDVVGGTNAGGLLYDVLGTTNLASGQWFWVTNTPTCNTVVMPNQAVTQTFYILRSTADSDGSGFPDWWQLQYFGHTGVDPYADPDGDGWDNLQEYQNQTNPNHPDTPPPPRILSAVLDSAGTHITLVWQSGGGSVINYGIEDSLYGEVMQVGNSTFSQTILTPDGFDGDPFDYFNGEVYAANNEEPTFQIRAYFTNGIHADSTKMTVSKPTLALDAQVVRGPLGQMYLAIASPPTGLSYFRFLWMTNSGYYIYHTADVSATNLANGVMLLPTNVWQPYINQSFGLDSYIEAFTTNGAFGYIRNRYAYGTQLVLMAPERVNSYGNVYNYVDARGPLKANLNFLLRAATVTQPFSYASDWLHPGAGEPNPSFALYQDLYCARPPSPTNYEYYGFHYYNPNSGYSILQELRPVQENFLWANLVYEPAFFSPTGGATNGIGYDDLYASLRQIAAEPEIQYFGSGTETPLSMVMNGTNGSLFVTDAELTTEYGLQTNSSGAFYLPNNVRNVYGLALNSMVTRYASNVTVFDAGGAPGTPHSPSFSYSDTTNPQLQIVDYYFNSETPFFNNYYDFGYVTPLPSLPGSPSFAVTNVSPLLITSVGRQITFSGWAKMSITNGYVGKYAYLEQYFDKAYTIGTNGVATTNSTGILSPYGEFLPTAPGPAALVTMPDIDTGQRGTGVVQVIKLQLDVNHDGVMDLSFAGPDNTSQANPMKFWANGDNDGASVGQDIPPVSTNSIADYSFGQIRSQRNLEDFARLWIYGVPSLPSSQGYDASLTLNAISGSPAINLYVAYETNGGTLYLTDTNVANNTVTNPVTGNAFAIITNGTSYLLPYDFFNGSNKYFLFEGAGVGKGELVLTIYKGTNVIAKTSAWLDLHDIKDFYEEAAVTNVIQTWPEMVEYSATSGFKVQSYSSADIGSANQMAVFVHGWRMTYADYNIFSQTMLKRLYWQGFQGRFAALRWPTRSKDTDPFPYAEYFTYNRSEHIAFESGTGAAAYLYDLRHRYTNYTISMCAHSMGNILAMQALKYLASSNQAPIDNYVLMQAAVPAQCYDTTVTNLPLLIAKEASFPTPNTYSNYAAEIGSAIRGNMVNFFNPDDFALVTGTKVFLSATNNVSWEGNQAFSITAQGEELTMKPNAFFGYYSTATTGYWTNRWNNSSNFTYRVISDPHELMPFVSRPRSKAVGAQPGVGQVIGGGELDLKTFLGFTEKDYDHSGQFNRNIQEPQVGPFYFQLRQNLFAQ